MLPAAWPQRFLFLAAVRRELETQPSQCAYYPGARARRDALAARYDSTATFAADEVAFLELGDVSARDFDGAALDTEVFGPLLACALVSFFSQNKPGVSGLARTHCSSISLEAYERRDISDILRARFPTT